MKPLISYYGGKSKMASKIVNYINQIPHTVYVEPFCGGAAVLFDKPKRVATSSHHYREVINDTSDILISLYRCATKCPNELALELESTLYSQSDHARAKVICKNPKDYTQLEIAWAYFVNINSSFANQANKGWGTSATHGNRNFAYTWHTRITSLKEKLDRLQSVHISCEDALRCIDRWDSPHSLIYCDPPYPGTDQGHYAGYTTDDWIALCDKLDVIQGSYILSNYPQEYEPKSAQQRIEISATMTASKNKTRDKKRTEVLWICDRGKSDRPDIQKLLDSSQMGLFA